MNVWAFALHYARLGPLDHALWPVTTAWLHVSLIRLRHFIHIQTSLGGFSTDGDIMTPATCGLETVLIVDDDPILSAIADVFFQKRGVSKVYCAGNGRDALEIIDGASEKIDFVLCDLNMPELDGIQFLRHLKDRQFSGQIAILSGEQQSVVRTAENLAQAHNLNVVGTLGKPLKLNDLEGLMGRLSPPVAPSSAPSPVLATVADLRQALTSGDLVPYYQPKVDIRRGKVSGAEALARWTHPKLGVIGPNFFIPMAEQNALIGALTECMIAATISNMVAWRKQQVTPKVSVNLGAETLTEIGFPDQMSARLNEAGIECARLVFEITERQLVAKDTTSSEVLARLRLMGCGISIDDFGTGYSNIEQLREFPFTELKIDQSFIRAAAEDQFAHTSVEASVNLGKQLDLRLVAEGVETAAELDYVTKAGIDEVQGYYIGRPMPADEFVGWVQNYEGRGRPAAAIGGLQRAPAASLRA